MWCTSRYHLVNRSRRCILGFTMDLCWGLGSVELYGWWHIRSLGHSMRWNVWILVWYRVKSSLGSWGRRYLLCVSWIIRILYGWRRCMRVIRRFIWCRSCVWVVSCLIGWMSSRIIIIMRWSVLDWWSKSCAVCGIATRRALCTAISNSKTFYLAPRIRKPANWKWSISEWSKIAIGGSRWPKKSWNVQKIVDLLYWRLWTSWYYGSRI